MRTIHLLCSYVYVYEGTCEATSTLMFGPTDPISRRRPPTLLGPCWALSWLIAVQLQQSDTPVPCETPVRCWFLLDLDEQKHFLPKGRVSYRVPHFGVRRSLSLAKETGNEHRTRSTRMPHFLLVQAWIRLNEICPTFEDHIDDS